MDRSAMFRARLARITPYDVVRVAAAVVLLTAAGLKAHQLATSPVLGDGFLDSRWLLIATVEFEIFFGLWLLANILPAWTRRAAIGLFALFAAVSLYKALTGHTSCGCFGRVEVNPWWTLGLDVGMTVIMWGCVPRPQARLSRSANRRPRLWCSRNSAGFAVIWLTIGVPTAAAIWTYQPSILTEEGVLVGENGSVVLEPEKWIGKQCPLLPLIRDSLIDSRGDNKPLRQGLAEGEWTVVLYRDDCPICQEHMARFRALAQQSVANRDGKHFAIIGVPPCRDSARVPLPSKGAYAIGHLDEKSEWYVQTPVIITLKDRLVVSVRQHAGAGTVVF